MAFENRPVPRTGGLPMSTESREQRLGEFGGGLLRSALVDPVASREIGFNRCPDLGRVDLALERLLALTRYRTS